MLHGHQSTSYVSRLFLVVDHWNIYYKMQRSPDHEQLWEPATPLLLQATPLLLPATPLLLPATPLLLPATPLLLLGEQVWRSADRCQPGIKHVSEGLRTKQRIWNIGLRLQIWIKEGSKTVLNVWDYPSALRGINILDVKTTLIWRIFRIAPEEWITIRGSAGWHVIIMLVNLLEDMILVLLLRLHIDKLNLTIHSFIWFFELETEHHIE